MQGFLLSSYAKHLPCANYLLLEVTDAAAGRKWLGGIVDKITTAEHKQEGASLNIAFTATGLSKLGLTADELLTFSRAFQEGMTAGHRSHILGDRGASDPSLWEWGNSGKPVDILLLVFAFDEDTLAAQLKLREDEIAEAGGIRKIAALSAGRQPDSREHFGFLDGVGQPSLEGTGQETKQLRRTGHATVIRAGEFVLGYENEMDVFDPVPAADRMPAFGANGTYLVFRQIEQDVFAFWDFLDKATRRPDGTRNPDASEELGAKMVGRWRSGAPITKYRDGDPQRGDPEAFNRENDFEYAADDKQGFGCPFGAHIRRANPRDSLPPDPLTAKQSANRHRIMRRGRSYGDRADDFFVKDDKERGLHFICLNSDIERQFEFVQQNWINNQTFAGLFDEVDPLVGRTRPENLFTIQGEPVRKRVPNIPEFVKVKGGSYFFIPGIQAIRYLASL